MSNENDEVIALCTDCGKVMSEQKAENDPFLNQGDNSSCKLCGGVVIVTYASERESILEDRRRGKTF